MRAETINYTEEKIGTKLVDLGPTENFMNLTSDKSSKKQTYCLIEILSSNESLCGLNFLNK